MKTAVLDVGGTAIKSGLWSEEKLTEVKEWDTNVSRGGDYLMERMTEILRTYRSFEAIGISTTGQVDTRDGSIYYANQNAPGYTGMRVKRNLEDAFGVPIAVENDVNAAALGELYFGAARDLEDFLCITYGTGVGGAIVIKKQIYPGDTFSGGSFGGIVVHPENIRPGVPYSGCYEKYAATAALVQRVKKVDETLDSGRKIFSAMERSEVKQEIDGWIDEIVYGLLTLIHAFNPSHIIMGGGVMSQTYILDEVKRKIRPLIIPGCGQVELRRAGLGNQAGLYGAAALAQSAVRTRP